MKKDIFLFDLDGTITDPKVGITRSVQYSLSKLGIDVADPDDLQCFIGPPLRDSYRMFYGLSPEDAERAVSAYRERYAEIGIFENALYGGMDELLKALRARGGTIALATSKPTVYAARILDHFGLAGDVAFVAGSELDGSRSAKIELIEHAMRHLGDRQPGRAIMIGDRQYDVLGAQQAGIDSVGVVYGYGGRDELERAGATHIAETVEELLEVLLGLM